jgi:hypothetical protein
MEISIEFKQKPKNTFDITIERERELIDGSPEPTSFDDDERKQIRDTFRSMVIELYNEYIPSGDEIDTGEED